MRNWLGPIVIIVLLAVVIGVPLAMRPAVQETTGELTLVVVTPHNEQIRYETSTAFNRWRAERGLPAVEFDFRSGGGTSDLRKQIIAEYEAEARRALEQGRDMEGVGYDLFFGGGDYEHNKLAQQYTVEIDSPGGKQSLQYHISVLIRLAETEAEAERFLREVYPEPTIAGALLYHPDKRWMGVVLASFGIVYNRDAVRAIGADEALRELGVETGEPRTWSHLVLPVFRRQVALADPAHSGSITEAYNAILMRVGWGEGWQILRRVFANARYFTMVSSKVPVDVSAGEAAAGMCIDFYGRFQASAVEYGGAGGESRIGYVDPPGMTKINADPVSVLYGAPHEELAHEFVRFLLTKEGQRLWQRKVGADDGPVKFELRRQPVRRDLYTPDEMAHWTDDIHPFEIAEPFPPGMPNFFSLIATVSHAMAIDVHRDLIAAWDAIVECDDPALKAELIAQFDRMPDDLVIEGLPDDWLAVLKDPAHARHQQVADTLGAFVKSIGARWRDDPDHQLQDRIRWTAFFRANYRDIVRRAEAGR